MNSREIDEILSENNYKISFDTYIYILKTSPQIRFSKYNDFNNKYEMETDDKYHWHFEVFHERKDD